MNEAKRGWKRGTKGESRAYYGRFGTSAFSLFHLLSEISQFENDHFVKPNLQ